MSLTIQTGTVSDFTSSIENGWYTVTFPSPFSSTPVVLAQIQTRNGEDTPGLRLKNVSASGFDVRMDELIMNNATSGKVGDLGLFSGPGKHPNAETLGWVAIEA